MASKPATKKSTTSLRASGVGTIGTDSTVSGCPRLAESCRRFLLANTTFESSTVLDVVMGEIEASPTIISAFRVPLRHKIVDYAGALKWLHFLAIGAPKIMEDDGGFSDHIRSDDALLDIAEIYDLAAQDQIWDHCQDEDEDEEEDDDYEVEEADASLAKLSGNKATTKK